MTDLEIKSIYKVNYFYLLSLLYKQEKGSEAYNGCVKLLEEYRIFVKEAAQLEDLPEVPKA